MDNFSDFILSKIEDKVLYLSVNEYMGLLISEEIRKRTPSIDFRSINKDIILDILLNCGFDIKDIEVK